MVYKVKSLSLYSDFRWNGFSNTEELGKQYFFIIMYIHSFFYIKALDFGKKRAKLRTKSGMLNIKAKCLGLPFAILNIIRAKHQNRAWLSLTLYCMQTSLLSLFYHILFSPVTDCTKNKHYKRSFFSFWLSVVSYFDFWYYRSLLYYGKFKQNREKPRTN